MILTKPETLKCRKCGQTKLFDQFPNHSASRFGKRKVCKSCVAYDNREYFENNRERINTRNREWNSNNKDSISVNTRRWVLKKYGMTFEGFQALWDKQDGKCAICEKLLDRVTGDCQIDHAHVESEEKHDKVTGPVRGLLCRGCNIGLGAFQDNIPALFAAIRYLKEYENG